MQIGIKGRERVEIAAGLTENDLVVTNPPKGLEAGEAVRVRLEPQGAAPKPDQGAQR